MEKNNWIVITGGPHSGKTKCLEILSRKGFRVLPEAARVYIDQEIAKGITAEELRKDEHKFQMEVLKMKIEIEKSLFGNETILFDRGIPDTIAYFRAYRWSTKGIEKSIRRSSYKKVFLLDMFGYKKDYARTETEEMAKEIHNLLEEAYKDLGIPVIAVPNSKTIEEKANFILSNL